MPLKSWVLALALLTMPATALATGAAAAPPSESARGDLRIVVFGDFNGPYGSLTYPAPVARVLGAITEVWRPDLVLMPGDLVAGQSRALPGERFAEMWTAFDAEVAAPLRAAGIPYAAAIGNHDGSSERGAGGSYRFERERLAASAYWSEPMYASHLAFVERSRYPFDYAFRAGEAFIVVLDASSATVDAAQRAWLSDVLSRPEAAGARLRLVTGHLPLYAVVADKDRPGEVLSGGPELQQLMEAHGVDTFVSGHHAAYYAGRSGGLELLFAGGIGGRALIGSDERPRSAVTVLDIWYRPLEVRYTSIDPATMTRIAGASLPTHIVSHAGRIERSQRALP